VRRRIIIGLAALALLATGCTWGGDDPGYRAPCGIDSQGREWGEC
jgi:hypothetical protein